MATFKCEKCGATKEGRCKPKECHKCGESGTMNKQDQSCDCSCGK
jgi:ABC-type ATPase with predicted acetyltransferase domain